MIFSGYDVNRHAPILREGLMAEGLEAGCFGRLKYCGECDEKVCGQVARNMLL